MHGRNPWPEKTTIQVINVLFVAGVSEQSVGVPSDGPLILHVCQITHAPPGKHAKCAAIFPDAHLKTRLCKQLLEFLRLIFVMLRRGVCIVTVNGRDAASTGFSDITLF